MNLAFKEAVETYLSPVREQFNYQVLLNNHLDSSRFHPWIEQLSNYRTITGASVLSSGCGSGGDLESFLLYGASHVTGIEVDTGLSNLAHHRFAGTSSESQVEILTYDGYELPLPSSTFDIVFSMHVIEHTKNVGQYLGELLRVLKVGGILFLELPNRYFKYEQHINMPYIHHLPRPIRNRFVTAVLKSPIGRRMDETNRFKLGTMYDYHIPSPKDLVASIQTQPAKSGVQLIDAHFHSYSLKTLPFEQAKLGYYRGDARKESTFRMVVGKVETK